ncbi:MAG: TrkH family potassium uptake protein [Candidatus Omnitrophota bacterium]
MIQKPSLQDIHVIIFNLGKIIFALGVLMVIPLLTALGFREWEPMCDFLIGIIISLIIGILFIKVFRTKEDLKWLHGMVVTALAWIIAMVLGAIPLYLSGHFGCFLDACFDAMSGFATTGLTLINDMDHLSYAHNMWRHLIMFIGGQGIVVVALAFLMSGASGAFRMYVGEARDEKILPNVIQTARFIWFVSIVYLILGTLSLAIVGLLNGMPLVNSIFHGMWIFMAAFDTGGFAPQSQNILYYHSLPFEVVTIFIMLLGSINFKLHHALWTGNRKEIYKNIETITLFITIMATFAVTAFGLYKFNAYPEVLTMFRKGFYQLVSGHTGTGYMTLYARQFIHEWGTIAMVGVTIAMAFGGSACSTTGGIKVLRIGLLAKALKQDIKQFLVPESTVVIQKFHHIRDIILNDKQIRSVFLITLSYLLLYGLGTLAGIFCGYPLLDSLFESTSAAANVGLSCGITLPTMPALLKVTYIIQMWAGRLEFICIFVLIGFLISIFRGK